MLIFSTLFFLATYLFLAIYSFGSALNPDWDAYENLYLNNGGYIAEQGRDPAFLFVNEAFNTVGISYYYYRIILDIFFILFSCTIFYLTCRSHKRIAYKSFLIIPVILLLFVSRSLFQLREGLAVCFIISFIFCCKRNLDIQDAVPPKSQKILIIFEVIMQLMATVFHLGYIIYLITYIKNKLLKISKFNLLLGNRFVIAALLISFLLAPLTINILEGGIDLLGDGRFKEYSDSSIFKFFFWGIKASIAFYIYKYFSNQKVLLRSNYGRYLLDLSRILLLITFLIISLIYNEASTFLLVAFVRLYDSLVAVLLFAFILEKINFLVPLIAIFLLIDQFRYLPIFMDKYV